jgi:phosphate transport system permease protein
MMKIQDQIKLSLQKRHKQEKIFKAAGIFAIILSLLFLIILFASVISKGYSAFLSNKIAIEFEVKEEYLTKKARYRKITKNIILEKFGNIEDRSDRLQLMGLFSRSFKKELKDFLESNQDKVNQKVRVWFTASSNVDIFLKQFFNKKQFEINETNLTKRQINWINELYKNDNIKEVFNINFLKNADSREPEIAGIGAGITGSFFTIIIFLLFAFPVGVMAGIYLEEFAKKNIVTDIIEISINNLAAIPSILYGLLGLIVYLNMMHLPRSSAIVGGLTLSLLVLPIIIIATRNAINTIPTYIKDAAIALGASKMQIIFHYIFPLSLPGIMTGTILAISRALGETAPLIMIGMIAFVADVPTSFSDPTSVLPVQVYLWSDAPEPGFAEKTAGAIMILLIFLISFNAIAVYLRKKFEKKW